VRRFLLPALLLAAGAASAQEPMRPVAQKKRATSSSNFRISFKLRSHELQAAGNFTVADGAQANYVVGGERPEETPDAGGKPVVDFKKHGLIVDCVPTRRPSDGLVDVQCQFELTGVLPPTGAAKARPTETFQYQTDFSIKPGSSLVLVDEPDRRVELKLEELAP
jgi:hypothetical protein